MWLLTPEGFYSVTTMDERNPLLGLQVRARVKSDLERLLSHFDPSEACLLGTELSLSIVHTPTNDYKWRVFMTHEQWSRTVAEMASRIDYHNFKSEVERRQGKWRHDIYMRVWSALLSLQRTG